MEQQLTKTREELEQLKVCLFMLDDCAGRAHLYGIIAKEGTRGQGAERQRIDYAGKYLLCSVWRDC
jgi:hypothetical protein